MREDHEYNLRILSRIFLKEDAFDKDSQLLHIKFAPKLLNEMSPLDGLYADFIIKGLPKKIGWWKKRSLFADADWLKNYTVILVRADNRLNGSTYGETVLVCDGRPKIEEITIVRKQDIMMDKILAISLALQKVNDDLSEKTKETMRKVIDIVDSMDEWRDETEKRFKKDLSAFKHNHKTCMATSKKKVASKAAPKKAAKKTSKK